MKLISWNVAGSTRRTDRQAQAIQAERPDVLVLQEITRSSAADWKRLLGQGSDGMEHLVDGTDLVREERQYTELIASRFPLTRIDQHGFEVKRPERVLSARVEAPVAPVEIHTTHVPPGVSTGWEKIEHLRAIYRRLAENSEIPRILCGDFNTPRAECPDGRVIT
jgi:endonuclease/exonuclease/phosphatase family metal-dependent hydrolase